MLTIIKVRKRNRTLVRFTDAAGSVGPMDMMI